MGSNFYWLSSKPEVLDWEKSHRYFMPNKSFADFTAVNTLPASQGQGNHHVQAGAVTTVKLANTRTDRLLHRAAAEQGRGRDAVVPVLWSDNYVSLLPGETKTLKATFADADLGGAKPTVAVTGWNLEMAK